MWSNNEYQPGHEGYEGNEKDDELSKKGARTLRIGPEPTCKNYHKKSELK